MSTIQTYNEIFNGGGPLCGAGDTTPPPPLQRRGKRAEGGRQVIARSRALRPILGKRVGRNLIANFDDGRDSPLHRKATWLKAAQSRQGTHRRRVRGIPRLLPHFFFPRPSGVLWAHLRLPGRVPGRREGSVKGLGRVVGKVYLPMQKKPCW